MIKSKELKTKISHTHSLILYMSHADSQILSLYVSASTFLSLYRVNRTCIASLCLSKELKTSRFVLMLVLHDSLFLPLCVPLYICLCLCLYIYLSASSVSPADCTYTVTVHQLHIAARV